MSKKYICLIALLMMSLYGCGKNNQSETITSSIDVSSDNISFDVNSSNSVADEINNTDIPSNNFDSDTPGSTVAEGVEFIDNVTKELALNLLNMKINDALALLGTDYAKIRTGIEDSEVGYQYPDGILLVVDSGEEYISRIELFGSIKYEGVLPGMKFDEIIQVLGDVKIQEVDYETHTVYRLVYDLGDRKCTIRSESQDGSDNVIVIH